MIERLSELERAATPGPWHVKAASDGCWWLILEGGPLVASGFTERVENADYIAASRNALPALLEVARAAETLVFDAPHDDERGPAEEALHAALSALDEVGRTA